MTEDLLYHDYQDSRMTQPHTCSWGGADLLELGCNVRLRDYFVIIYIALNLGDVQYLRFAQFLESRASSSSKHTYAIKWLISCSDEQ